jgi:Tol biopolymer transport system component
MTTRFTGRALLALILAATFPASADAQYFGRNKVQYEKFDWRILKTDHFDLYFYPAESLKVHDAGRQSERWYTRLSDIFRHQFDRKSIVWYADHPDFQQTNVIGDMLSEGTGGVTEGLRTRVVMPFTGIYADDEHVTGHELVHVFQYNIAETAPGQGGLARMGALPLWLIEGMAEYFSLGRNDALTAMWMRDAVLQNRFPTIKQLTTDPRFFPYRYGQALWAYIGGRWGDRAVVDVYRAALRVGWDQALVRTLGLSSDSLSKDWASANRAFYAGQIAGRTHPDSVGRTVVQLKERSEYNLGPSQSPDGRHVAFFTSRTNLFGIDLVIADATNGRIVRQLAGPQSDGHIDAISFINSSGEFSPDGSRFAFVVYANGDNQITILNTANGDEVRRFQPDGVGSIYNVAYHPNGRQLVFTGTKGGISDLYLVNEDGSGLRQLTNDQFADLQPTFSPDGRTIAFATDRNPATSFERLTFGDLQLATLDVETGAVTIHTAFPTGKHINPQYSPDGRSLYFISDQDGVSDVYRMELGSNQIFRLTRLATGASGISHLSPALSVARGTGTLMFTVFKNQGHEIVALDASRLTGEPVTLGGPRIASAAVLPPGDVAGQMTVATYLNDPTTGLVMGSDFRIVPYRSSFALDALGQPSLGVVAGGPFGTGLAGGISALFGDQLGDQMIYSVAQLNGTVKDFGGAVQYLNLRRRWNWGAGLSHIPIPSLGYGIDGGTPSCPGVCQYQVIQRIFVDQAQVSAQYPFSQTRRFELGVSGTRLAFDQQIDSIAYTSGGIPIDQGTSSSGGPPPLYYAQGSAAFVGDNSFSAYTSPISGTRYRFEAAPTFGSVVFNTGLADYRRYLFARPFTLAFRGMHYGRYGKDSDNYEQISPLFLGEETLIRGYRWMDTDECIADQATNGSCPTIERLLGSRLAVFNAEFRIPVLGGPSFGLINFPYLPLEVSPFFDAGIAWTSDQSPDLQLSQRATNANPTCNAPASPFIRYPCAQRIPVFSAGVSFRVNLLGYMIIESYIAKPFQRPTKDWVFGLQLAPGW